MPELPEVEIIRQSLDKKIRQKKVKKVIIRNDNLRIKLPKNFKRKLENKKVSKVEIDPSKRIADVNRIDNSVEIN